MKATARPSRSAASSMRRDEPSPPVHRGGSRGGAPGSRACGRPSPRRSGRRTALPERGRNAPSRSRGHACGRRGHRASDEISRRAVRVLGPVPRVLEDRLFVRKRRAVERSRLDPRRKSELLQDVLDMALDRELGDLESGGHLPVPCSSRHETQNLALAHGEDRRHLSIPAPADGADRGTREIASQRRLALRKCAEGAEQSPAAGISLCR